MRSRTLIMSSIRPHIKTCFVFHYCIKMWLLKGQCTSLCFKWTRCTWTGFWLLSTCCLLSSLIGLGRKYKLLNLCGCKQFTAWHKQSPVELPASSTTSPHLSWTSTPILKLAQPSSNLYCAVKKTLLFPKSCLDLNQCAAVASLMLETKCSCPEQ